MSTIIGAGISTKLDSFAAGKEAALNAYYQLGRYEPDILVAFISTIFEQAEVIKGIKSIIKETSLIGCSSIATISSYGSIKSSVSLFAISSDSLGFFCGKNFKISQNPRAASHKTAIEASKTTNKIKDIYMMFSDCLSGNGTDIIRGAQEVLGTSFPIIGGCATGEMIFQKTYQYLNNNIYTDSLVGLLVTGDIATGIGKANGWQPLGKPHVVTRAKSNLIKEIDRKAASEIYQDYFEKSFEELKKERAFHLGINYPLGLLETKEKNEYIVRMPLRIEDDGTMLMSAEIEEGEDISLMIGDKNLILDSAKRACVEALNNVKNKDIKFAVIFSDIARLQLLRKDAQKEIDIIKNTLGKNIPIIGCYTCGEYVESHFNNHTISITVFAE